MRRFFSVFLTCSLVFLQTIPSFAFTATPSEISSVVATPSNALYAQPFSSLGEVTNTISYDDCYLSVEFLRDGSPQYYRFALDDNGYASSLTPTGDYTLTAVYLIMNRSSLPPSGQYTMTVDFTSNTGFPWKAGSGFIQAYKDFSNSTPAQQNFYGLSFQQNSGDFQMVQTVDLSYVSTLTVGAKVDTGAYLPVGGYWKVHFTPLDSNVTPDLNVDIGQIGSVAGEEAQIEISNTVSSINNQMSSIDGSLKEIVQTISQQLEAFWNQLAGEFTNLYSKLDNQHEELLNALQDGLEVTIINEFDELIANDNKNHQEQIANDDKNTEEIINGYDNSSITADNDRLNTALENNDKLEEEALGEAAGHLEDFEFTNPITQYLSTFILFGDFLQDLFTNSGAFFNVINLSFILSIALIVIGLYRFKGGS